MTTIPDYGDLARKPDPRELAVIDSMIERLASTSDAGERERLALRDIPDEMFLRLGLREHVTASGMRVVIEDSVRIMVEPAKRVALHAWLRERGYAEELSALHAASQNKNATRKAESAVLGPLALRLLKAGTSIDSDLMGVSRLVKARLSRDSADLRRENVLRLKRSPE